MVQEALLNNSPKYEYVKQKFLGHRNARTMIKEANFWGDEFVSQFDVVILRYFHHFTVRFSAEVTVVIVSSGTERLESW